MSRSSRRVVVDRWVRGDSMVVAGAVVCSKRRNTDSSSDFLGAFAFAGLDVDALPVNVNLGQLAMYCGESQFIRGRERFSEGAP